MSEEHDLQEVPGAGGDGERIQESAVEVASFVSAGASLLGLGMNSVQAYYARASYELDHEAAEARADRAELRRELHEMRRTQAFELGGLDALDEFDEWHYDGSTGLGDY
jgi:hypothetical protein